MEPPFFDGRTPITKEFMNDIVDHARRAMRMGAAAPLEMHNLGSAGMHVRLGTATGASAGEGFWARLDVNAATNQASWYEVVPGVDPTADGTTTTLIEKPGGRTGNLGSLTRLFQGLGNLRPVREQWLFVVRFNSQTPSGTFTVSRRIGTLGPTHTTAALAYNISPTDLQTALNAPTPGAWTVVGTAGLVYYLALNPAQGAAIQSSVSVPTNTTGIIVTVTQESAIEPGSGVSDLYNFLPGGQAIWVRPLTEDGGTVHYVFTLPYAATYVRITGLDNSVAHVRYLFVEQMVVDQTTRISFLDRPGGLAGSIYEANGEPLVPPNTIVMAIPLFKPGSGFRWLFQAFSDWRLLVRPADISAFPAGTNAQIQQARQQDAVATGATPYASLRESDDSPSTYTGTHLALRMGSTTEGWPIFRRMEGTTTGWSGALTVGVLNLTVVNGRVTAVA